MYDRNVEFPQRYRLQKVDGTDDIFDLIPTPGEIRNEGTLINKSSLLKDATAALFGLSSDAVPNDAFSKLSGLYQHWWKKTKDQDVYAYSNTLESTYSISAPRDIYTGTYDEEKKTIALVKCGTFTSNTVLTDDIIGKFMPSSSSGITYGVCLITGLVEGAIEAGRASLWAIGFNGITFSEHIFEQYFVQSSDRNAYPDSGFVDMWYYEYCGIPFDNAVTAPAIATGSYTGTNKYGSGNKNTLTFPFEPKLVIVGCLKNEGTLLVLFNGETETTCKPGDSNSSYRINVEWSGNTIKWYGGDAVYQMNNNGTTYAYIAIG